MDKGILLLIYIFLLLGFIISIIYIGNYLYRRIKRRFWELFNEVTNLHLQMDQVKQQMDQVKQQMDQEHLTDMAIRAKSEGIMDEQSFRISLDLIHEMKMDNFKGMENIGK